MLERMFFLFFFGKALPFQIELFHIRTQSNMTMNAKGSTINKIPANPTVFAAILSSGALLFVFKKAEVARLSTRRVFSMSRLISSLSVTFQLVCLANLHRQRHTCIGVVCSVCAWWSPFEVVLTKISFSEMIIWKNFFKSSLLKFYSHHHGYADIKF